MLFTRTHIYYFPLTTDVLKSRLIGKHVKIHNMDFEVMERDERLSIIPHAEQEEQIKTLPITSVQFQEQGNKTKVVVRSKMRTLDSGGPMLIITFCSFMLIAAAILLKIDAEPILAYVMLGISSVILLLFGIRMQTGYFDYVRKVHSYVKGRAGNDLSSLAGI